MKRFAILLLACLAAVWSALAQSCASCGLYIEHTIYTRRDAVTDETKKFCESCTKLKTWCYLCGLPARKDVLELPDGRALCARDAKGVVLSNDEARQICAEAWGELARLFSRFLVFPESNVSVAIEDKVHMDQLFQAAGFDRQCPSVMGYVKSRRLPEGKFQHPMSLLSAMPRGRLRATYAHELAHTWLKETLTPQRDIDGETVEGFCELVAYKLMDASGDETEKNVIRINKYSRGQIDLFIEADARYGFYVIMEWMKSGIDQRLHEEDLDRIRKVEFKPQQPLSAQALAPLPYPVATPVPDTLTLIGISGSGKRRLALINDRAFAESETGKVRVGMNNITVRCLEIRTDSVVIQAEGSEEKQELPLRGK